LAVGSNSGGSIADRVRFGISYEYKKSLKSTPNRFVWTRLGLILILVDRICYEGFNTRAVGMKELNLGS
jgi:hypothetical protein